MLGGKVLCGLSFAAALCAVGAGLVLGCVPMQAPVPDVSLGPVRRPPSPREPGAADQAEPDPPAAAADAAQSGPLKLRVEDAILTAVANNRALRLEQLHPAILRTFEDQELAVFDPVLGAGLSRAKTRSQRLARAGAGTEGLISKRTAAGVSVDEYLPTGTSLALEGSADVTDSSLYSDKFTATRVGLTVTQALLQGYGLAVNLASLRQARLDTLASHYELRGFVEALVSDVEQTYWDYALAERQIEIFAQSLKLAEQQLNDTQERIRIGRLAETELAAARAEVALRREALINARSALATTRLRLLRLLNPPGANLWQRQVTLLAQPGAPEAALDDVEAHVRVALRMRPDLNEARLRVRHGTLEIVRTRNGLLPRLDLFVTLGKSGYASSFGPSVREIDAKSYDLAAGLAFEYPLGNRDAQARHERAVLTHQQAAEAVDNLAQLVQVDVRSAYIEVTRAREQVAATAATRRLKEEALRAETGKFGVGKSTSFLVAQAQRDLVASQIAEVEAVVNLLKGLVELYRLEGSLLERRGIAAPGREPVGQPAAGR